MKPVTVLCCVAGLLVVAGLGLLRQDTFVTSSAVASGTSRPAADARVESVEDSMHEFMEYVFQPTYRRLRQNMKSAPADNAGWKAVKSDSLILAESCNLLISRQPDENSADWCEHATSARSAGAELYKAAKTRNFEAAGAAYRTMLDRCNACHKQFEEGKHILEP